MRPTLTGYVSRQFLGQLVLVGFGFVALLQVFDLLKNAQGVMERHGGTIASLAYYVALRLPGTISFLLPLCVLVAALMTLTRLAQHNEIVAMKAAGLSHYRFLLSFVPAAFGIAAAHWLLSDQIAPAAHRALQQWDAPSVTEQGDVRGSDREVWVRSGRSVVRIAGILDEGRELVGVTLFLRDDKGNVAERLVARQVRHDGAGWRMVDVARTVWPPDEAPRQSHLDQAAWQTALQPSDLADISSDPNGLTMRALLGFADASGLGRHPKYFYRTWVNKRIATPIGALVMILLAASVAQTLARGHGGATNFAAGVGLGFLYLIADGLILTLGEAGTLPPLLAAWTPLAVFGCIGGAALVFREGV